MKANEIIQEDILPQVGDHFDIELGGVVIESVIVGETDDGYIVEADDRALALMKVSGALLEEYTGFKKFQDPNEIAKQELAKGLPFKTKDLNKFSDPKQQQEYQRARLEPKNHPGFLGKMTESSDDVYTIVNPDNQDEEIEVQVEWSSYQDEFEIDKIVRVDTGEDITEKVKGQSYWNLTYDVQQRLQQQRSRGDHLEEAEYQGRKVSLGKPFLTPDGPKKRSVYVKNPKGNVVKVNFGDKKMKIKKSNPKRRKSFRARHNCSNPGPRHRAKYWSCRAW